jgi:hypothetical protein
MTTITIPKAYKDKDELVIISRDEYESLVKLRRQYGEEVMSPAIARSLARMRKAKARGRLIPFRK